MERVVAIGASAGGLEALQSFLGDLQAGAGSALLIAQHLAPGHPSLIVDLLSRATDLPVVEAIDGAALVAGQVTVIPPSVDARVVGTRIALQDRGDRPGPCPSIDLLMESIAEQWGPHAVGVILSGTGSDGAHGLRAIRGAGGCTMVQSPDSARFDGMPRAALAIGSVDLVADPADLGRRIADLSPDRDGAVGQPLPASAADMRSSITGQLRHAVGIDFSRYKESTLRRQIQRRMAVRQAADIDAYFDLLAKDPAEGQALAGNLLVTVTSFFRDPEAFDALGEHLRGYVRSLEEDRCLRVWVPGCATGEEAYSIAILIADLLGRPSDLRGRLKVFGTDLDEAGLAIARRAAYPASAISRVPEGLRSAYLRLTPDGFTIADVIRECTVFARHDVCVDPPFPRIDLISCRNTLIYFTPPLQRQVLGMFAFSLRSKGLLLLGKAENLERRTPGFDVINGDWRLFERNGDPAPLASQPAPASADRRAKARPASQGPSSAADDVLEREVELLHSLIRETGQAYLVLDDEHRLVHVVGDVADYCQIPEGRLTTAAGSFLRPELQDQARTLFLLCRADRAPVASSPIRLDDLGLDVVLTARPVPVAGTTMTALGITRLISSDHAPATIRDQDLDREIARLERELLASQDTLRRSLAELQSANEELEASSEELQASSEELQASSEELQASNEELQATNEELGTLNQQLRLRGDELQQLNADLENIQASLSQGMVIVDERLRVARFTPLAVRVFALLDTDIGQPLTIVPTTMQIPALEDALRDVVSGGPRRSLQASDGSMSYLVQVLPYRSPSGTCLGAIVTLTDVSEMVALRNAAESALAALRETAQMDADGPD
ncbi:MAG: PAS domain-containing protein [Actinomycetales bacterium]|nr:PAS domain-containing protein [Actinomycetales bacterium]